MSQPVDTTNSIIFYTIKDFFSKHLEKYNTEYLNSNIQRILDTVLDYNTGVNVELKLTGTLCEDMIDKYNKETYGKNIILNNIPWPYEKIIDLTELHYDRLPRIDGPFGFYNGAKIEVDLSKLVGQETPKKVTDIMYFRPLAVPKEDGDYIFGVGIKIGEYLINTDYGTIDLMWILDSTISLDEFFGPADDYGTRPYTEFQLEYYPFDKNSVNIPFEKNVIPRLRNVTFTTV
jgi:hypothetical protein